MNLMTETCTLVLRGEPTGDFDAYGNPTYGPGVEQESPCWYEPRGSSEDTNAKDQQIYGYWVYLPLDAPLGSADAVKLSGLPDTFQVIGETAKQPGGFIVPGFQKAAVEKVSG